MGKATEKQIDILRHATGWPICYRNHFVTDKGSSDYSDCEQLAKAGYLRNFGNRGYLCGNLYCVTDDGFQLLEEISDD